MTINEIKAQILVNDMRARNSKGKEKTNYLDMAQYYRELLKDYLTIK